MSWAIWITGIPGSGKSTLARAAGEELRARGYPARILELDQIRKTLTPEPRDTDTERDVVYRALAWMAGLLTEAGVSVIVDATAHRRAWRDLARAAIPRFAEVQIVCPLEVAEERERSRSGSNAPRGIHERAGQPGATVPGLDVVRARPGARAWSSTRPASPSPRRRIVSRIWLFCSRRGRRGQPSVPRAGRSGSLDGRARARRRWPPVSSRRWRPAPSPCAGSISTRRVATWCPAAGSRKRSGRFCTEPWRTRPSSSPRPAPRSSLTPPRRGATGVKQPGIWSRTSRRSTWCVRRRCVSTASEPRAGAWAARHLPPPTGDDAAPDIILDYEESPRPELIVHTDVDDPSTAAQKILFLVQRLHRSLATALNMP